MGLSFVAITITKNADLVLIELFQKLKDIRF